MDDNETKTLEQIIAERNADGNTSEQIDSGTQSGGATTSEPEDGLNTETADEGGTADADASEHDEGAVDEVEEPAIAGNTSEPTVDDLPTVNGAGHRNTVVNNRGVVTVLDDEVAAMFFDQPNFYSYIYDSEIGDSRHISFFQWADSEGRPHGAIGTPYRLGE